MCELCRQAEADGGGCAYCQDCGMPICFDALDDDAIMFRAYVTASGDLFCARCGRTYDEAEEYDADLDFGFEFDPYDVTVTEIADAGRAAAARLAGALPQQAQGSIVVEDAP